MISLTGNCIADKDFFGVSDGSDGWSANAVLQYDSFPAQADDPGLSLVREAAQAGNYTLAKEELLKYYRAKRKEGMLEYPIAAKDEASLMDQLTVDKILTNASVKAKFEIPAEPAYISIPLQTNTKSGTFFLMDADMDGTRAEMHSMENEENHPPYIEAAADGHIVIIPVSADTYLSSGANKNSSYGSAKILYIEEKAGPGPSVPWIAHSTDTARPYMHFNLPLLDDYHEVTSMTLYIFAKSGSDHTKHVYLFGARNFEGVDLDTVTWNQHRPPSLNFKETGYLWLPNNQDPDAYESKTPQIGGMKAEFGVEFEWGSARTRLTQIPSLLAYYKGTGDEEYACAVLELLLSMYNQWANAQYPRNLDAGWRTRKVLAAFFGTLDSCFMTPDILTALLKFAYSHASWLRIFQGADYPSNWQSAFSSGFFAVTAYLPELAQPGWWTVAKVWMLSLYDNGTLINSDGSYPESCTNYIAGVLGELSDVMEIIRAVEGDNGAEFQTLVPMYTRLATYYVDLGMNYGFTPSWGDGGRLDVRSWAQVSNQMIGNPYFEFIGSSGESGESPHYTSRLYSIKALAILRQNWEHNGLSAFINTAGGGTHGHADDLALDVYAYGYPLLVDAGTYSYEATSPDARTRKKTLSHNTIEIDGQDQNMDNDAQHPGRMILTANPMFDLLVAETSWAYTGFTMARKVFFLKNTGWIVTDVIVPQDTGAHSYKQAWHPNEGNTITVNEQTKAAIASIRDRPSITIIPADPDHLILVQSQNYMAGAGSLEMQSYIRYEKSRVTGPQTFDTVLFPDEAHKKTDVTVERIEVEHTEVRTATALALLLGADRVAVYYTSNQATPEVRAFGHYSYDGEVVYVEKDGAGAITLIAMTKGRVLKSGGTALVQSETAITDLTIEWKGGNPVLSSSAGLPPGGIEVYSPSIPDVVTLNGTSIPYVYQDNMILINIS